MNEKELPEFAVCPLDALEIDGTSPCRAIDIAVDIDPSGRVLCGCARHGTRWHCKRLPEGIWDQPRQAALFHSAAAAYKLPSNYDEDVDGAPCSEDEFRRALGCEAPPQPPTLRENLVAMKAKNPMNINAEKPWQGPADKKPWRFRATAVIPHRNTPEHLELCVQFLEQQTELPYIMIIDTGSDDASLARVLALRSESVEVHQIACHGIVNYVDGVCAAMDAAMSLCRTEYLWCLHSDCFVINRKLLAELLEQADGGKQPVIGYESVSANKHAECKGMVSHTCTLLHIPTMDRLDVTWSMRRLKTQMQAADCDAVADVEMALNYRLRERGIVPLILGSEQPQGVERDANRVHLRSATLGADLSAPQPGSRTGKEGVLAELHEMATNNARSLFSEIKRRNLLFYVLPLRNPAHVWQWHVAQLRRYLQIFNGRRIVTIATHGGDGQLVLDAPERVKLAFGSDAAVIEFREMPNDPNRWEAPAFIEMLSSVASQEHDEASFYFHAKGVRRMRQAAVRPWCEQIYHHNLGCVQEALQVLRWSKACGAVRRQGDPTQSRREGAWHFSGTGFWFRHDTLFSRPDWAELSEHSHAVEAYLSNRFSREECHCLAHDDGGFVYDPATWRCGFNVEPTISILVVARNYGRYLRDCLESCFWQTHKANEVIYVDDASDDNSLDVAREFESQGLRIIPRDQSEGVEAARNFAAVNSSGDALLFVDGDNILPINYLATSAASLNWETPFVYPDLLEFGCGAYYHRMPEFVERDIWRGNFCDTCSLMWRDAFDAAGGWIPVPNSHMEDWHLFLRMSHFGDPRRADVALCYRRHGNSRTAQITHGQTQDDAAAVNASVTAHVQRWCKQQFGRALSEKERSLGLLGLCNREATQP